MNRIREIREAAGLSVDEVAERAGTSGTQIRRLETGTRRLTVDWMQRLAEALECSPADLIATALIAGAENEVEPADMHIGSLATAIARKGLKLYRVTGGAVTEAGIQPGDLVAVDENPSVIAAVQTGDIVLVKISAPPMLVLRQYMRPGLIITNRLGANIAIRLDDRSVHLSVVGVLVRD